MRCWETGRGHSGRGGPWRTRPLVGVSSGHVAAAGAPRRVLGRLRDCPADLTAPCLPFSAEAVPPPARALGCLASVGAAALPTRTGPLLFGVETEPTWREVHSTQARWRGAAPREPWGLSHCPLQGSVSGHWRAERDSEPGSRLPQSSVPPYRQTSSHPSCAFVWQVLSEHWMAGGWVDGQTDTGAEGQGCVDLLPPSVPQSASLKEEGPEVLVRPREPQSTLTSRLSQEPRPPSVVASHACPRAPRSTRVAAGSPPPGGGLAPAFAHSILHW